MTESDGNQPLDRGETTMMVLCACLFLASLLTPGFSWSLNYTHSNVVPDLTTNVILTCFSNGGRHGFDFLSRLSRIRLLKLDSSMGNRTWEMYAEILHPESSKPILKDPNKPGVSVSGLLGQPSESFLSVTWSVASRDTVGIYKCEIDGFNVLHGDNEIRYSNTVRIISHTITVNDFLDIVAQMKKRSEMLSKQITSIDNQHAIQRQMLETRVMKRVQSAIQDNYFEVRYWPTGTYSMLTDAYGCPNTQFSTFSSGYINVESEAQNRPKHVFPPLFNYTQCTNCGTRSVLRFNYCTNNRKEPRLLWPQGSYCIQRSGTTCTSGFSIGYTTFYLDSLVSLIFTQENVDGPIVATVASKVIYMYFCCRSDAPASTPILLPNAEPFYLFRNVGPKIIKRNDSLLHYNFPIYEIY